MKSSHFRSLVRFFFFKVSVRQLQNLLEEHDEIPWEALTFLTGEVIYGGRVTDEWDMRCLGALLKRFLCPEALNPDYSYSPDGVKLYVWNLNNEFTWNVLEMY